MIPASLAQEVPQVRLPDETAGLSNIAKTLVSTFDVVDVLALADTHQRKIDSDLRLAVVRDPEFAQKVHFILVEFANTVDQPTLDRYITGENVPPGELQQVWRNTCCGGVWDSPVYAEFLAAVRNLNKKLPLDRRIRVLAGDPPAGTPTTQREASAVAVLRSQVLDKGGKALVIYGGGHVGYGFGINRAVLALGRQIFVAWAMGGQDPAYQQLDRKLKSPERPVLFSAAEAPVPNLGVGFVVDAFVYFGSGEEAETRVEPVR
ncbi:MAG TPA: hypothetical protein VH639_18840 [Bryobacteraceae bacterium]|jgi:hypothetical protein